MLLLLVCAAIVATASAESSEFYSKKFEHQTPTVRSNIFVGNFTVKLDHFRAQDPRTVQFVSLMK